MSLSAHEIHRLAVVPALDALALGGDRRAAERLVLATACAESNLSALEQHGNGPARGLWQIEPATHRDLWINFLDFRDWLADRVYPIRALAPDLDDQLAVNLVYGAAICRLIYYRRPEPLPPGEAGACARYWKAHYNTELGKGTVAHFVAAWRRHNIEEVVP